MKDFDPPKLVAKSSETPKKGRFVQPSRFAPPHALVQPRREKTPRTTEEVETMIQRSALGHSLKQLGGAGVLQTKLTLGPVDDPYEREADQVARQVVAHVSAGEMGATSEADVEGRREEDDVQRQSIATAEGGTIDGQLESSINSARSGGRSLSDGVRGPMESAFGADFSGVKIHTDSSSDQLNRSLQSRAFTTGQDIFFRQGESPESSSNRELLAHELTHVVQQNGSAVERED